MNKIKFDSNNLDPLPEVDDSSSHLPSFENEINDELDIPTPPKELKAKKEYQRMQDIEDEYLKTNVSDEDIDESLDELEKVDKKEPIFVNLEDYASLIETIKSTKTNFKIFQERFENINVIKDTKFVELDKLNKVLESLQRRIISVDNDLFESAEE